MPIKLTARTQIELEKDTHENSLILEIDGYTTIYSSCNLLKEFIYGDVVDYGDGEIFYGEPISDPNGQDLISVKESKKTITQQLEQDRGSAQGVTSIDIVMVDKNQMLTEAFSPGGVVLDPLGVHARVYLSINNSAHPQNTILLLSGIIQTVEFGCADCRIVVGSPEQKKKANLYEVITSDLDGAIDSSVTTITVNETTGIVEDQDIVSTYIQIEEEIIKVGSISGNSFIGCTRGRFDTIAVAHDDEVEVETRYRFIENPIDLALKLMLSGSGTFLEDIPAIEFIGVYGNNDLITSEKSFVLKYGLVVGDLISASGSPNGANNFTERTIVSIQEVTEGTKIEVSGAALVLEFPASSLLSFKSKYDTLPQGMELNSRQVDVEQHEFLDGLLAGDFPTYDFFLKDDMNGKDFLHKEVYFPVGLYSIPRKGKASVNITLPPLAVNKVYQLNDCTVKNAEKIRIKRSINKYFYNSIIWKFDPDQVDDKFRAGDVSISGFSKEKIKLTNRPLRIESQGLRDNSTVRNYIVTQTNRFLDRYQFAAESLKCSVMFSTGFPIEVGDATIFGENLKVTDINTGTKDFTPRLMEVVQKSFNIETCNIDLTLVDTKVGLKARFGVIAPSSPINSSSTTTRIFIDESQTLGDVIGISRERDKWPDYIGSKINVHSQDWSDEEEVTLTGFDPSSDNGLLFTPPLTFTPGPLHVVDAPTYPDDVNPKEQYIWKAMHVFTNATIGVTSGDSDTVFDIAGGDLDKIFLGSPIEVHTDNYSDTSSFDPSAGDAIIIDIVGTKITVDRSLTFTPSNGDKMQLNSYPDKGYPYRYI